MSRKNNDADSIIGLAILIGIALVLVVVAVIIYLTVMLGGFAAVVGALYGAVTAVKNYFRALFQNVKAVEV